MLSKVRKHLRIFTTKDSKIDELSEETDYDDLKFIVNSSGLENGFSELKDSVAFLDSIKNGEISLEETRHKQKNLVDI